MKIKAEVLIPLVLDFAEKSLSEDDFKVLEQSFLKSDPQAKNYKDSCLV